MSAYNNEDLYRALKELEIVDVTVLDALLQTSKEEKIPLGELVIKKDLMNDDNLGRIIGDMISTPYINLTQVPIEDDVLLIVPESVARKQSIISFKKDKTGIHVATTDPTNRSVADFIGKKTGESVKIYYTTEKSINFALSLYSKDMKKTFNDIIAENIEAAKGDPKAKPPITKIVDTIIVYAYRNAASDIHIEPMDEYTLVRFRIDGILQDIVKLPSDLHEQMIMRIKVMANLRTIGKL
jgi:type IV pilus assembly protein PilB